MIRINEQTSISDDELVFTASHSSGPGGQNVNKVSSRVTLWFDVANSQSISQGQKDLIMCRLASRIGRNGLLRVICQQTRSQSANRELAVARFTELLQEALRKVPTRKKTRVGKAATLRRLEEKKHRSILKSRRSNTVSVDD